jgi:hypothetical protein
MYKMLVGCDRDIGVSFSERVFSERLFIRLGF